MKIFSTNQMKVKSLIQKTDLLVGSDLLVNLHEIQQFKNEAFSSFLLLSDKNVFALFGNKVINSLKKLKKEVVVSLLKPGEIAKNTNNISEIVKPFFQHGFDQQSAIISLGGGVVSDIGGFLASILLRGIPAIHIPTTLLAQIDAAIGGKTGVNIVLSKSIMFKNMLGTIKQPKIIISDVETLQTLPEKEITNGLGEMVKYWVGWGRPTKYQISKIKYKRGMKILCEVVDMCQKIKLDIVKNDPWETKGIRQNLNLGHTVGHALEGLGRGKWTHGECVAIGIVAAAKISKELDLIQNDSLEEISNFIKVCGLPTKINNISVGQILEIMKMDKKGGNFVLIKHIGKLQTNMKVPKELITKVLQEIIL